MSWMASRIAGRAVRWIGNQRLGDDVSRVMNPFKCLSTANNAGNAPVTLPKAPEPQIVEALVAQTHTSAVLVPPQQVDGTKVVVKVPEEYPRELLASEPAELPKTNDKVVVKSPEEYPRELLAPEPAEPPKANDKVVVKVPEEYPRELLASEPAEPPKTNDKVVVKVPEEYPCELSAPAEIPKRNDLELPKREDSGETTPPDVPKAAETEPLSSALPNLGMKERQARSNSHEVRKDSVDKKETAKFAAIAATWWDPKGPYKPLHIMNPTRVSYIRSSICQHFRKDANTARPLEGLKIVDVGCGGGLVCEPFARMGAEMTGVDAVEKNIGVASVHAGRDPSTASIKYLWTTAEQLVREEQKFDVVLALEVIEHVADPEDFCRSLAALTKKDGLVFISTLNRSLPSFGLAIVAAEYILGWLPKGTHEWSKFITPGELSNIMDRSSIEVKDTAGMVYNPITQRWSISGSNTSVNYIAYGVNRSIKI